MKIRIGFTVYGKEVSGDVFVPGLNSGDSFHVKKDVTEDFLSTTHFAHLFVEDEEYLFNPAKVEGLKISL